MSFNTFGKIFRFTTWGESHGPAIGCVIDGCPPNILLSEKDIQTDMDRRRPGQSKFTTQRKEPDRAIILSGVFEGKTTGTPISIIIYNEEILVALSFLFFVILSFYSFQDSVKMTFDERRKAIMQELEQMLCLKLKQSKNFKAHTNKVYNLWQVVKH